MEFFNSYTIAGSLKYDIVNNNVHHSYRAVDESQGKVQDRKDHWILQISH